MLLSDAQRAFLDEVHYAVVGTLNPDGTIQQTVVWYLLEDNGIRISIGAGSKKIRNLRANPTMTVTVEAAQRYLTLSGTAQIEPADQELRRRLAIRYVGADRADEWLQRRPDAPRATLRMIYSRVYGQGFRQH